MARMAMVGHQRQTQPGERHIAQFGSHQRLGHEDRHEHVVGDFLETLPIRLVRKGLLAQDPANRDDNEDGEKEIKNHRHAQINPAVPGTYAGLRPFPV